MRRVRAGLVVVVAALGVAACGIKGAPRPPVPPPPVDAGTAGTAGTAGP